MRTSGLLTMDKQPGTLATAMLMHRLLPAFLGVNLKGVAVLTTWLGRVRITCNLYCIIV